MINKKVLLYTGIVTIYFLVIISFYLKHDSRASELNNLLSSTPELNNYPYQYRVLKVDGDTAVMAAPNSTQVSSLHALEIIYPKLKFKAEDSQEMQQEKEKMLYFQNLAAKAIREQSDIKTIRWQIDTAWFTKHGIEIERLCNMHNLAERYITEAI